jgi:hypothetical protein
VSCEIKGLAPDALLLFFPDYDPSIVTARGEESAELRMGPSDFPDGTVVSFEGFEEFV